MPNRSAATAVQATGRRRPSSELSAPAPIIAVRGRHSRRCGIGLAFRCGFAARSRARARSNSANTPTTAAATSRSACATPAALARLGRLHRVQPIHLLLECPLAPQFLWTPGLRPPGPRLRQPLLRCAAGFDSPAIGDDIIAHAYWPTRAARQQRTEDNSRQKPQQPCSALEHFDDRHVPRAPDATCSKTRSYKPCPPPPRRTGIE